MLKKSKIENDFQFLINNGYSMEKYIRPPDEEYVFSKEGIKLEVYSYLGILPNYKKTMCFSVLLTVNGVYKNILEFEKLFGSEKLTLLKRSLDVVPVKRHSALYAEFLRNNLELFNKH